VLRSGTERGLRRRGVEGRGILSSWVSTELAVLGSESGVLSATRSGGGVASDRKGSKPRSSLEYVS
jgi:hypothetical protein